MRPSEALERHRGEVLAAIARLGASNPRLFGSVARGEDHRDSDVDILVDLPPGASYFDVFKLEDALRDILGCKVDVYVLGHSDSSFAKRIAEDVKSL